MIGHKCESFECFCITIVLQEEFYCTSSQIFVKLTKEFKDCD